MVVLAVPTVLAGWLAKDLFPATCCRPAPRPKQHAPLRPGSRGPPAAPSIIGIAVAWVLYGLQPFVDRPADAACASMLAEQVLHRRGLAVVRPQPDVQARCRSGQVVRRQGRRWRYRRVGRCRAVLRHDGASAGRTARSIATSSVMVMGSSSSCSAGGGAGGSMRIALFSPKEEGSPDGTPPQRDLAPADLRLMLVLRHSGCVARDAHAVSLVTSVVIAAMVVGILLVSYLSLPARRSLPGTATLTSTRLGRPRLEWFGERWRAESLPYRCRRYQLLMMAMASIIAVCGVLVSWNIHERAKEFHAAGWCCSAAPSAASSVRHVDLLPVQRDHAHPDLPADRHLRIRAARNGRR